MHQNQIRLFGLDILRALAISLVLISHCTFLAFPNTVNPFLNTLRLMGAIGVDLFFVLSGYLIGGILLKIINEEEDLKWLKLFRFWKRRWFRTLPNYFLILVINIILALMIGLSLPENTFLYALFLQNFAWEHPNYFTEAWSLSIEEFAYLLLPLGLFLVTIASNRKKRKWLFFMATLIIIVLLTLFKIGYFLNTEVTDYHHWSLSFRKVVIYRMDSIYYGFLGVYCVKSFTDLIENNKTMLLMAGLLVFFSLHAFMYALNVLPETHLWFYTFIYLQAISCLLLLMFPYVIDLKGTKYLKSIIEFISTRSYAIYLVNYSLILLHLQQWIDVKGLGFLQKIGAILLFLTLTFTLSNIIYVFFEKPILRYRDKKFPR